METYIAIHVASVLYIWGWMSAHNVICKDDGIGGKETQYSFKHFIITLILGPSGIGGVHRCIEEDKVNPIK